MKQRAKRMRKQRMTKMNWENRKWWMSFVWKLWKKLLVSFSTDTLFVCIDQQSRILWPQPKIRFFSSFFSKRKFSSHFQCLNEGYLTCICASFSFEENQFICWKHSFFSFYLSSSFWFQTDHFAEIVLTKERKMKPASGPHHYYSDVLICVIVIAFFSSFSLSLAFYFFSWFIGSPDLFFFRMNLVIILIFFFFDLFFLSFTCLLQISMCFSVLFHTYLSLFYRDQKSSFDCIQ